MWNRSCCAGVLAAMLVALSAGTGWTAAPGNGPESTAANKKAAPRGKVPLRFGEEAVMQALAEPTEMEFVQTPLTEVVAPIQNKHHIYVHLDKRALDDVGLNADTPITFSMSGAPLDAALSLMLRDLDLSYTVCRGVLLITTKEEEEGMLLTRTYDVTDLVVPVGDKRYDSSRLPTVNGERSGGLGIYSDTVPMSVTGGTGGSMLPSSVDPGPGDGLFNVMGTGYPSGFQPGAASTDFGGLVEVITRGIAPVSWDDVGGPGSITSIDNSLVISQTLDVHRQIETLLAELRARQRGVPTVAIDARWLLLDSEGLRAVVGDGSGGAGSPVADAKMLDHLARSVPGARGRVACLSGTATYLVAGDRRSLVTGVMPVVDCGTAYQPVVSIPNVGVLLQILPVVDRGEKTAVLHLASTVTRWRRQPAPVSVQAGTSADEMVQPGDTQRTLHVSAATVDRPRIAAQEVATSLRVPLGRPILIGGLTFDPAEKPAADQAPGERKQLHLFLETSVVPTAAQPRDRAASK